MLLHLRSIKRGDLNSACSEMLTDCWLIESCFHEINRLVMFNSLVFVSVIISSGHSLRMPRAVGLPISESGCVTVCFLFIPSFNTCLLVPSGWTGTCPHGGGFSVGKAGVLPRGWVWKAGTELQVTELFVQRCGQPGPPRGAKIWKTSWIALAPGETRELHLWREQGELGVLGS